MPTARRSGKIPLTRNAVSGSYTKSTPPPLGYDPGMIWKAGPQDPGFGLLKLTPWRIEVSSIYDMAAGTPPLVWRARG